MKILPLLLLTGILACQRDNTGPAAPKECEEAFCGRVFGTDNLIVETNVPALVLRLDRAYTNADDIVVSWTENPELSDYVLNIAEDPACLSVTKSLSVKGYTTHLVGLEEGAWYLCLKPVANIDLASSVQQLVVDRQPPIIQAASEQSLASGEQAIVQVSDLTQIRCSWASADSKLVITDSSSLQTTFTATSTQRFAATLTCQDQADNISTQEFGLNIDAGNAVTAPPAANVRALVASADTNSISLTWKDAGGAASFVVLESSATIPDSLVDRRNYAPGMMVGAAKVKAVGTNLFFTDTNLPGNSKHFYKVFAANAAQQYTSGVEVSAVAVPLAVLKTTLALAGTLAFTETVGLQTVGSYNYLCRGSDGFSILNVANPAAPVVVSTLALSSEGWCSSMKVLGKYAYIADFYSGLVIVDVSNPAAPIKVGSVPVSYASWVHVEGSFAYVAVDDFAGGGGLSIINISNPATPVQVSYTNSSGRAMGVAKAGNFIYLTHGGSGSFTGMKIYDVTQPSAPVLITTIGRTAMGQIEINSGFAFATLGSGGLEIFDVSVPSSPKSLSVTALPNNARAIDVKVQNNYAFVTGFNTNSLLVFDVTNKSAPTLARNYTTADRPRFVHINGVNAFISRTGGFEVVGVFDLK